MTALAMMLGGAVSNALAFTGSNYFFSKLNKDKAEEETLRHDKAEEELEKAQSEWSIERARRLSFLRNQEKKELRGTEEYYNVNKAMQKYYYATGGDRTSKDPPDLVPKPKLGDFYTPSEDQKNIEIGFIAGGMILTGIISWGIYKYEHRK